MPKFTYSIKYEKTGSNSVHQVYHGGDTEAQAKETALKEGLEFHNRWNENKLTEKDFKITECYVSGDYAKVLSDLERG